MKSGEIFLIKDDGQLVGMKQSEYESEDLLQELLQKYPNLLAGDQIDSKSPRRWLLISREIGVPGEEEGADRWSLDHLFLDQDGIPTLVEVKRSSDTRIRREVVGQMLDYAANAVAYWPIETIRAKFEARCDEEGIDAQQVLSTFLSGAPQQDEFWPMVKTNLQAGKIRLVFVADGIPSELRRIVEFLNTQMNPAEVLAVEISQYAGEGLRTLVPRVIGQTEEAQQKKSGGIRETRQWDESSFFEELLNSQGKKIAEIVRSLYGFAAKIGKVDWGTGAESGSFTLKVQHPKSQKGLISLITVWTDGGIRFRFGNMRNRVGQEEIERFCEKLSMLPFAKSWNKEEILIGYGPKHSCAEAFPNEESLDTFKMVSINASTSFSGLPRNPLSAADVLTSWIISTASVRRRGATLRETSLMSSTSTPPIPNRITGPNCGS